MPTDAGQAEQGPVLPPAVVVHGAADVRMAIAPGRPVLLLSGPGAAGYAGAGWWRAMIDQVLGEAFDGGAFFQDALDCSDLPGRALEALAMGCGIIVLAPCPSFAAIVERAGDALVLAARPAALDLAEPGAARKLGAWLG